MNEKEIKEKLEKLKEYEAQERTQKRWKPYVHLEKVIAYMHKQKHKLHEAMCHQDEAVEISREYGLGLYTSGSACISDAHEKLEKQIEAKEKEFEELCRRLQEEDYIIKKTTYSVKRVEV